MGRPTDTVRLTLDAHPEDRAAWKVLAARQHRLAIQLEQTPVTEVGERERIIAESADNQASLSALDEAVSSGVITVTVEQVSRGAYRNLLKNHPPVTEADDKVGYDMDTFGGALIRAATVDAHDHHEKPMALDVDAWLDEDTGVPEGDFQRWFKTALALNLQDLTQSPQQRAS